ncbi:hypothetical protein ACMD2_20778 [Ananas comosus]|uniref:Uncharacterized protein n=1 Tax=Ananas comosus TaxID=4615 RepID=A0A199VVH7_ANACO|nr:hypothetical protein ACMD2_20778 [Ananas comosus]
MDGPDDLVRCTYAPLPLPPPQRRRSSARPLTLLPLAISSAALLLLLAALSPWTGTTAHVGPPVRGSWAAAAVSRGPAQGVSEKSTGQSRLLRDAVSVDQPHAPVAAHGLPLPAAEELDERS